MIWLFVTTNVVSLATGLVAGGIIGAVLYYNVGYQRGRDDERHDRIARLTVRAKLSLVAPAPRRLPAAQRDHADAGVLRLVRISRVRKAGRS